MNDGFLSREAWEASDPWRAARREQYRRDVRRKVVTTALFVLVLVALLVTASGCFYRPDPVPCPECSPPPVWCGVDACRP